MYTDYFFIVGPNPHHQCKIGLSQRFVKRLLGLLWCCAHKNRNPGERPGRQRERRGLLVSVYLFTVFQLLGGAAIGAWHRACLDPYIIRSEEPTSTLPHLMRSSYDAFRL